MMPTKKAIIWLWRIEKELRRQSRAYVPLCCPGCGADKVTEFCAWWCLMAQIHGRPKCDPLFKAIA